nr:hypothetical protein [Tanacetum cinerariifolium]
MRKGTYGPLLADLLRLPGLGEYTHTVIQHMEVKLKSSSLGEQPGEAFYCSGFIESTTYFSNPLLEEFADEPPPEYDDNLQFDIEPDLKEIESMLYQDKDSSLKDSINQKNRANLADIFVDSKPEMFTDEHALDYSSPPIFDVYDDDFLEVESDAGNVYDDPFDSKGEKIKESKLLIDELDLPCDFHPPSDILENVKTLAKGFCTKVFISSASIGNHVSKSNRITFILWPTS